jgi:hypothetical protein
MTSLANRFVAIAAGIADIEPEGRLAAKSNGHYRLSTAIGISPKQPFENAKREP